MTSRLRKPLSRGYRRELDELAGREREFWHGPQQDMRRTCVCGCPESAHAGEEQDFSVALGGCLACECKQFNERSN